MNWHEIAIELYSNGYKPTAIKEILEKRYNMDIKLNTIKVYLRRNRKKINAPVASLLFKGISNEIVPAIGSIGASANEASRAIEKVSKVIKRTPIQNQEPNCYDISWAGNNKIKFAIMGDTQFGSKYAQITYLKRFYELCAAEGISEIYHTGDITDGLKMRQGHEYELYVNSADELVDDVIINYPRINGIKTMFITGNHDASIYKHVGYDVGYAIEKERDDLIYLGRDCAVVNITPNCTLELKHPWDGTAYAISYKPQKAIESMEADSKPNILAIGHYHKAEYLFYRNVHCIQTGCFQSQTPFTRGKNISVWMGGWIITVYTDDDGRIQRFSPEFVPFYAPIKDDYKNYYHRFR